MKNNEERFFLYLKDKMDSKDRLQFEDELKKSEKLRNDLKEYKNLVHLIDETKTINLIDDYLKSIVPNFRGRLERIDNKRYYINLKYIFASILIFVAGYFIVSQIGLENGQELKQVFTDLSDDEINFIANELYFSDDLTKSMDDYSSQKIDSIYSVNLNVSLVESIDDIASNFVFSKYSVTDIDEYLSDNDIELIYSQLIEKKIL